VFRQPEVPGTLLPRAERSQLLRAKSGVPVDPIRCHGARVSLLPQVRLAVLASKLKQFRAHRSEAEHSLW
jgi:hypothetical protein